MIRNAQNSDISVLVELVRLYWEFEEIDGFDPLHIAALLKTLISKPHLGSIWTIELSEQIVGYLLVTFVFTLEHGGVMAEIDEFFVLPEHRSTGIGEKLLKQAEQDLSANSFVRLQLQLGRDNAKARAFYHRNGFTDRDAYELLDKPL